MEDRNSRGVKSLIEEIISGFPAFGLMARIVQLHHELHGQVFRVAHHKVEVFALDLVERLLPHGTAQTGLHLDDIGNPHLPEHAVLTAHRLVKHGQKSPLRRREQSGLLLVRKDATPLAAATQDGTDDSEYEKKHDYCKEGLHPTFLLSAALVGRDVFLPLRSCCEPSPPQAGAPPESTPLRDCADISASEAAV
jgi:hypothetical protein